MPLLVVNMGAEMIYILEQRLFAQSVTEAKAAKVLQDVLRTMFSLTFVDELFKPQDMYSSTSTRQIFNKLAHSSIMKINEQSMEKLYDLMTMGVKYQFQCCSCPQQMLHVTLNHVVALRAIADKSDVATLLEETTRKFKDTYCRLSYGDWCLLKWQAMHFFQGRKVKVSLFLQTGIQSMDGTLAVDVSERLPPFTNNTGRATYRDKDGNVTRTEKVLPPAAAAEDSLPASGGGGRTPAEQGVFFDPGFVAGINLYAVDKPKLDNKSKEYWLGQREYADISDLLLIHMEGGKVANTASRGGGSRLGPNFDSKDVYGGGGGGGGDDGYVSYNSSSSPTRGGAPDQKPKGRRANAVEEFNLLANLMGTAVAASEARAESKPMKMDFDGMLFGEDGKGDDDEGTVSTTSIDGNRRRSSVVDRMKDLGLDEESKAEAKGGDDRGGGGKEADDDDDDDLLSLMDSAK